MVIISRKIIILFTSSIISSFCIGQNRQLHIDDTVPDVAFNIVMNYDGLEKRLSDFTGKFIILDFWDKTCGACIAGMPKMQYLQERFKNDIQIILVTRNNKDSLANLFKNSAILKNIKLPFVFSDTVLTKHLFPYKYLPSHIWLGRDRKVLAVTDASSASVTNISKMIESRKITFVKKEDIYDENERSGFDDHSTPLMHINNSKYINNLIYYNTNFNNYNLPGLNTTSTSPQSINHHKAYSLFMSKIEGADSDFMILRDSSNMEIGFRFINTSIYELCRNAYGYAGDLKNSTLGKVLVDTSCRFKCEKVESIHDFELCYDKFRFCYEIKFPGFTIEKGWSILKNDLEIALGANGSIESRPVKCLVLYRTNNKDMLQYAANDEATYYDPYGYLFERNRDLGHAVFKNMSFFEIVLQMQIANKLFDDPLILNESGFESERVNIKLKVKDLRDYANLDRELRKYGLGLREEIRDVKVLVLKNSK